MKLVTDLKDNEVIHCSTPEENNIILQLFHNAGLKWCTGKTYLEKNEWETYEENTCYNPSKGNYGNLDHWKNINTIIHPTSDFLGYEIY